jgi:hypothetical protein
MKVSVRRAGRFSSGKSVTNTGAHPSLSSASGARQTRVWIAAGVLVLVFQASNVVAQNGPVDFRQEPACQTLTPTSMGGPAPKNPNLMVLRWLGASNHELDYRGTIILINAYYQRTPPAHPLGFTRDDVKKANAVFIGHAHSDHMADAPYVAQRVGAQLIGAPITAAQAKRMGLSDKQITTVTGSGGEVQKFDGVTVEAALGRHNNILPDDEAYGKATATGFRTLMEAVGLARTPEQQEQARQQNQGSNDPHIIDQGTIAYLFTVGNGFHLMFRDGTGAPTDAERRLMARIGGRTDVAIVSHSTSVPERQIQSVLPLVLLYRPDVYMPTHHDDIGGGREWTSVLPLFMAIRDELPDTRSIAPLYRTPVCIDTRTKDLFVGR